jgi:putative peptidoglycan lipid II flippase
VTIPETSADRQIARAAGTVMAAFILSNLAGLVRQILVADAFGTGSEIDAFNAANRVSETLFTLVAGGALASAFIPTFTGLLTHKKRSRAWRLASAIANLLLLITASLGALAALFAPQIVRYILAPGFSDNPLQEALTIDLMRLMLPAAVLFSLSGLLMGILNAHQIFFIPALTPSMYQIGMILGVLLLVPRLGIYGLAWGVLIGAGLHLLLQVPLLLRLRGRYFPTFGLGLSPVREVLRLMGPRLLGVAVVQLNFWVNTRLASSMAAGSVTGILFGFTLMLMPQVAIAQSIAVAAMPTFSAQVALGKLEEMRASLASSLRGLLLLSIPASLGLMLLRQPLVATLYQRGEFTARSTELVAWALLWYGAGLVGHSVVEILARAFYSLHDTRTPVLVGTGAMTLNVIFSFAFSSLFANMGWMPHGGLALANSLATALEMIGLLILMRRRLNGLQGKRVLLAVSQAFLAASGMALMLWLWIQQTANQADWMVAMGGVIIGGVVYTLILFALGNHEVRHVSSAVLSRLGLIPR